MRKELKITERAERIGSLAPFVKANGPAGSELVKSFAVFAALGDIDLHDAKDVRRYEAATAKAEAQWADLSEIEQSRILNSWYPANGLPTVARHLIDAAGYSDNMMAWMLTVNCGASGPTTLCAAPEVVSSTAEMRVSIRQGTTKTQARKYLLAALRSLEENWDEAIALGEGGCIFPKPEAPLAIGTRVIDRNSDTGGGVIVGGYQGANGWAYCYLTSKGEVDFQYAGGLEIAPDLQGKVTA